MKESGRMTTEQAKALFIGVMAIFTKVCGCF